GVSISTAINWVRLLRETGSVAPGKMGGHRPKLISGRHRTWLLQRIKEGDFTLRVLVAELAERGLKVDLPDGLELRPRRETQFQKKAWWPASATVPTSYGGAHSGGSIKTRSSPSVSSSSMRLGPRPTWHHCVDGGRGAEGSKPKSRTVTGTRRRSWLRCVSIGSRRRGFLRVRSTVRPSKSMSKESLSPRFVPATS